MKQPSGYLLRDLCRLAVPNVDREIRDLLIERKTFGVAPSERLQTVGPQRTITPACPAEEGINFLLEEHSGGSLEQIAVLRAQNYPSAARDDALPGPIECVEERTVFEVAEVFLAGSSEDLGYLAARCLRYGTVEVHELPSQSPSERVPDRSLAATHVADDGDGRLQS